MVTLGIAFTFFRGDMNADVDMNVSMKITNRCI